MITNSSTLQFRTFSFGFLLLLGFILLFGLVGCGGGGGSGNQNANGLYKNGTATLDPGPSELTPVDLRGFVNNNRIIMFSIAEHILFDGQITSIAGSDFTAAVDLYEVGVLTQSGISVTGTVNTQSKIMGTLSGTGVASGSFTLNFDLAYNDGASIARIRDQPVDWEGELLSDFSFLGDAVMDIIDVAGAASDIDIGVDVVNSGLTEACSFSGTITIPDSAINMYEASLNVPSGVGLNDTLCSSFILDSADLFTGFAAVLSETGTDKEVMYAVSDGNKSVFGVLVQP